MTLTTTRRTAAVSLGALALALTGGPAYALTSPVPLLDPVTAAPAPLAPVLDPIEELVEAITPAPEPAPAPPAESASPSPSPSASASPRPVPVPAPVTEAIDTLIEAVTGVVPVTPPTEDVPTEDAIQDEPAVEPQGDLEPQPVDAPPATTPADSGTTPDGGSGDAALGSFGAPTAFGRENSGSSTLTLLSGPMIADSPVPDLVFPEPTAAPQQVILASRPIGSPIGLPGLVVGVAVVAVAAAAAAQVDQHRRRRSATV